MSREDFKPFVVWANNKYRVIAKKGYSTEHKDLRSTYTLIVEKGTLNGLEELSWNESPETHTFNAAIIGNALMDVYTELQRLKARNDRDPQIS